MLYLEGRGVPKNPDIALELFGMAVEEVPKAHNFMGASAVPLPLVPHSPAIKGQILLFRDKPDLEGALAHFQKGADKGLLVNPSGCSPHPTQVIPMPTSLLPICTPTAKLFLSIMPWPTSTTSSLLIKVCFFFVAVRV